jgi:hypothetical protein
MPFRFRTETSELNFANTARNVLNPEEVAEEMEGNLVSLTMRVDFSITPTIGGQKKKLDAVKWRSEVLAATYVLTFNDENNLEDEAAAEFIKTKPPLNWRELRPQTKQRNVSSNVCCDLPKLANVHYLSIRCLSHFEQRSVFEKRSKREPAEQSENI